MESRNPAPVCGVDEAGRGPIAGPVCAAAVLLGSDCERKNLRDSKRLSPKARSRIAASLWESDSLIGVGWAWPEEIDRMNIHHASLLAMSRAVDELLLAAGASTTPLDMEILVDGKFIPPLSSSYPARAIVGGDAKVAEISAASIIAKVSRDRWMERYSWIEPSWSFDTHKGYPTKEHLRLCKLHGLSPIHRRSFNISLYK
ncbi:MAG TPA: ribonuclease HII [Sediminispirochaeta sp.]|nr:ribonuclease HII [Sediminispirochaeta sp.]